MRWPSSLANPTANTPFLAERQDELIDLSMLKPVTERMHVETFRAGLHWVADNLTAAAALSTC